MVTAFRAEHDIQAHPPNVSFSHQIACIHVDTLRRRRELPVYEYVDDL